MIVLLDHDCRLHHGHRYLFHVWNGVRLGHFDCVRSRYRNFDRDRNWPLNWDWNVPGHFDWVWFGDGNGDGTIDRNGDRHLKQKLGRLINFMRVQRSERRVRGDKKELKERYLFSSSNRRVVATVRSLAKNRVTRGLFPREIARVGFATF